MNDYGIIASLGQLATVIQDSTTKICTGLESINVSIKQLTDEVHNLKGAIMTHDR